MWRLGRGDGLAEIVQGHFDLLANHRCAPILSPVGSARTCQLDRARHAVQPSRYVPSVAASSATAGVSCQAARINGGAGCQLKPVLVRFGSISHSTFHCEGMGHTLWFSPQYRTSSSLISFPIQPRSHGAIDGATSFRSICDSSSSWKGQCPSDRKTQVASRHGWRSGSRIV